MGWLGWMAVGAFLAWFLYEKRQRQFRPVPPGYQPDTVFPHTQEWTLYHNALSLCSMKSRLCMAELGLDYDSQHVDLIETGAYENVRPRLLDVNPGGTVPVLLHHGHPIYESHEQIRYAAAHAPPGSPPLVPSDPAARAEMEAWIDRSSLTDPLAEPEATAGNAIPGQTLPLFSTMIEKIPVHRILEGLLFHGDRRRPLLFLVLKLRGIDGLPGIPPAAKAIRHSRTILRGFLDELEAQLEKGGGPWILGADYTLADVGWLVLFERMRQADCEAVFLDPEARPHVADYWERLKDRPAYRTAILDHGHPLIEHGQRRIAEVKRTNPKVRALLTGVEAT